MRFERCYTASPFCMPARASVLTGRWPHAHGLWDNGVRLPPDTTTLATVLAQRGYRTGIVGKGHLDVHHLPDSPDSYSTAGTPRRRSRWGKGGWHGPYYGFQDAQLTCGHNRPCGHYGTWLHREHPEAVPLLEREHALEALGAGAWKSALPVELHASTWIGDRAVDFMSRSATPAAGRPFFLWASSPTRTRRSARPRPTPTGTTRPRCRRRCAARASWPTSRRTSGARRTALRAGLAPVTARGTWRTSRATRRRRPGRRRRTTR